nr:monocarboxylate transporter 14-like [Leptinotarsa decemlineata]
MGIHYRYIIRCIHEIGSGLMFASSLTILNDYFDKKHSFIMGISQTFITMSAIVCTLILSNAMEHMGFKNVLWLLAGISVLNFPAMAAFIPVKKCNEQNSAETSEKQVTQTTSVPEYNAKSQSEPLLQIEGKVENKQEIVKQREENKISLSTMKTWLLDTLGLRLYGEVRYLIMAFGLALSFNSDYNFTVIIRLLLNKLNYNSSEIAKMIMVYFIFDLISRMLYSIYSYFYTINNRLTFLWTTFIIAVCRIVFTLCEDYVWKMIVLGLVGLTRGIMETSLPLVISEMYKDNFATAFSLYMVLGGCVGLTLGSMTGYVKELTGSDSIIVYFYASANFITCLAWICETIFLRLCRRKHQDEPSSL